MFLVCPNIGNTVSQECLVKNCDQTHILALIQEYVACCDKIVQKCLRK